MSVANKPKAQHDRFIEAAKEIGADDDETTFKAKLAVIAKQKVKDEPDQAVKKSSLGSKG